MGFRVTHPIETINGKVYDEFYVRIENLIIRKQLGNFTVVVGRYDTEESARNLIGDYIEKDTYEPKGQLNVTFEISGSNEMKLHSLDYNYFITSSVTVTEQTSTVETLYEEVEYIDFDEDGNEIVKTKLEPYEVTHTGSIDVNYSKREIENYPGSLYELGYEKLKETYGKEYGNDNIKDVL